MFHAPTSSKKKRPPDDEQSHGCVAWYILQASSPPLFRRKQSQPFSNNSRTCQFLNLEGPPWKILAIILLLYSIFGVRSPDGGLVHFSIRPLYFPFCSFSPRRPRLPLPHLLVSLMLTLLVVIRREERKKECADGGCTALASPPPLRRRSRP